MHLSYILLLFSLLLFHNVKTQSTTSQIQNNQIVSSSLTTGGYSYYYFSIPFTAKLFKRDLPTIHLSLTACSQPSPPPDYHDTVPPLNLYISTSNNNTLPGPNNGITVDNSSHGLTTWTSDNNTSEVWIAVGGPSLTGSWSGNWTFEIGASTIQSMHPVFMNFQADDNLNIPYLTLDDTDRTSALFLSSTFQSSNAPNSSILISSGLPNELSFSYCAAKRYQLTGYSTNTSTTQRGPSGLPRQQFLVSNLAQDTEYTAYMVQPTGGNLIGITAPVALTTKIDANCRLIYDLTFCDQVAYSVPTGSSAFEQADLRTIAAAYDNQALEKFAPFNTSLSQYNCETTQYSLVRNCTDCYRDYKNWLCAVTIPRCTDSSSSGDLSQGTDDVEAAPALRDITVNASRNPWIDETMSPGEWTELLPCIDLCYYVVQSCPPFLQFYCPTADLAKVQYGYWQNGSASINGSIYHFDINNPTCNRMGVAPYRLTIGSASHVSRQLTPFIISCIVGVTLFLLL